VIAKVWEKSDKGIWKPATFYGGNTNPRSWACWYVIPVFAGNNAGKATSTSRLINIETQLHDLSPFHRLHINRSIYITHTITYFNVLLESQRATRGIVSKKEVLGIGKYEIIFV
jgi:hypothetical protein